MHFAKTTGVLAGYFVTTLAAPVTVNPTAPTNIIKREQVNDCESSSFVNKTTGASPLVADCQQLAANIAGGGTWYPKGTVFEADHTLASFGTCIFGAKSDYVTKVGNQDIIDLINSSIDMFQWEGLVGAEGYVDCQSDIAGIGTNTIWWGIYHS